MIQLIDFHTHRKTAEGVITPRSFGIHPWHTNEEDATSQEELFSAYSEDFNNAEIIGECGIDKLHGASLERQTELFRWQAYIAAEMGKPMVIHCVRAMAEVMEIRRKVHNIAGACQKPWVIHGFIGSNEQAAQLFRAGIWVSFGAAILDPQREKVRNCVASIETPFLLETDDSECGIAAIYNTTAEIRKCSIDWLSDTIKANYTALFQQ